MGLGFGVQSVGFRGLGFGVWGLGFGGQGVRFKILVIKGYWIVGSRV